MTSSNRQMVLMFADVCGNVPLFERMADTEALYAVDRCLKRMTRAVETFSGRVAEAGGGELLVIFETAEDACHAAIEIQQRVADLPPMAGLKLSVRIGLHIAPYQVRDEQLLRGTAITAAARISGNAEPGQILCSNTLLASLSPLSAITSTPLAKPLQIQEEGNTLTLSQLYCPAAVTLDPESGTSTKQTFDAGALHQTTRICVRYRGKAFLLDAKSPVLTIGRDLSNELYVDDRKASRLHARIERRTSGYFLVDSSTNGTFILQAGQREMLVRRGEIQLTSKGKLSFGCSVADPSANVAEFEDLG